MKVQIVAYGYRPDEDAWLMGMFRHLYYSGLPKETYFDITDALTTEPNLVLTGYGDVEAEFTKAFDWLCHGATEYVRKHKVGLPRDEFGELTRGLEVSLSV